MLRNEKWRHTGSRPIWNVVVQRRSVIQKFRTHHQWRIDDWIAYRFTTRSVCILCTQWTFQRMVQARTWSTHCPADAATNPRRCRCTVLAAADVPVHPLPLCCWTSNASTSAEPRQQQLRPPGQCCRRSASRRNRCELVSQSRTAVTRINKQSGSLDVG